MDRLHALPPLPRPATAISAIRRFNEATGSRPQSIFVAAGPYTLEDSCAYEVLDDLAEQVVLGLPDVVILMGPFVDEAHPLLASGQVPVLPLQLFQQQVCPRLERMCSAKPGIRVILIPSTRDLISEWCAFPQPPLFSAIPRAGAGASTATATADLRATLNLPANVLLFPNPVQFTVNEVVFAVSTCDILRHLGAEELSILARVNGVPVARDRFASLFAHVLAQRNVYPLFPPALDECPLDMNHREALELQVVPDVLLLPSALRYAVKEVEGCLCVNPGALCRGRNGGTFAKLCIHPLNLPPQPERAGDATAMEVAGQEGEGEEDATTLEHFVAARARVDIVKI